MAESACRTDTCPLGGFSGTKSQLDFFLPFRPASKRIQMKLKKIVGKKLKAIRLKSDMTIQELAAASNVSSNMISRVERGLTIPSV